MRKYLLLLLPLLLLLGAGFWLKYNFTSTDFYLRLAAKEQASGLARNAEREKLGLPLLPEHWYTRDVPRRKGGSHHVEQSFFSQQLWSDFERKQQPYHREKVVERDYNQWISETDRFAHHPNDSTTWVMELTYDFRQQKRQQDPRSAHWIETVEHSGGQRVQSTPLSWTQADSVLRAWQLR